MLSFKFKNCQQLFFEEKKKKSQAPNVMRSAESSCGGGKAPPRQVPAWPVRSASNGIYGTVLCGWSPAKRTGAAFFERHTITAI